MNEIVVRQNRRITKIDDPHFSSPWLANLRDQTAANRGVPCSPSGVVGLVIGAIYNRTRKRTRITIFPGGTWD